MALCIHSLGSRSIRTTGREKKVPDNANCVCVVCVMCCVCCVLCILYLFCLLCLLCVMCYVLCIVCCVLRRRRKSGRGKEDERAGGSEDGKTGGGHGKSKNLILIWRIIKNLLKKETDNLLTYNSSILKNSL